MPSSPRVRIDWETLIGGKWALWIGSLSLFLALACFLAYTWKSLPPAPPWAQVAMGVAIGGGFILAGHWLRTRTQKWFHEGLTGTGLAIIYLSIWAGAQYFGIIPFELAFLSMALTTVLGVLLAVRCEAQGLSLLAVSGGFLTPMLLQARHHGPGDPSSQIALLTYIAVLDAGILGVSLFKRWRGLTWLSFGATILLVAAWVMDSYRPADRWAAFTFVSVYFLLFLGSACCYSLLHRQKTAEQDLLLLFSATFTYAAAGDALIYPALGQIPGTFPLALALLFAFTNTALGALSGTQAAADNRILRQCATGLAWFFVTVAVGVQLKQPWLPMGWSLEAGTLIILSARLRAPLLQRSGHILWGLTLCTLMAALVDTPVQPSVIFLNQHAFPLLVSVLVAALVTATLHDESHRKRAEEPPWQDDLAPLYAAGATWGAAWLVAQETWLYAGWQHIPPAGTLFFITCLLAGVALGSFALGVRFRDAAVRLAALSIMALAIALPVWTGLAMNTAAWPPFWNIRWASDVVVAVAVVLMGRLAARHATAFDEAEFEVLGHWPQTLVGFVLTAVSFEVYFSFAHWQIPSPATWVVAAYFALSMWWSLFALVMGWFGDRQLHASLLKMAQGMAAIACGLVLIDAVVAVNLDWAPLANWRCAAFACNALVLVVGGRLWRRQDGADSTVTLELAAAGLLLWGATQETYEACRYFRGQLGSEWLVIGCLLVAMLWQVFALAMLLRGLKLRQSDWRTAAYAVGAVGVAILLPTALAARDPLWLPVLNLRFLAFTFAVLAVSLAGFFLQRHRDQLGEPEASAVVLFGLAAALLALGGLTQELYETCRYFRDQLGSPWRVSACLLVAVLWQVFALAILRRGLAIRQGTWRSTAYTVGAISLAILLAAAAVAHDPGWLPFANWRLFAFVVAVWTAATAAVCLQRHRAEIGESEAAAVPLLGLIAVLLALWGLTQEVYETCYHFRPLLGAHWTLWVQAALSLLWSLFGTGLLLAGIRFRCAPVRHLALGLLGLTVFKVFLFDLSFLGGTLRILSLAGLGVALIFISWLYARYRDQQFVVGGEVASNLQHPQPS